MLLRSRVLGPDGKTRSLITSANGLHHLHVSCPTFSSRSHRWSDSSSPLISQLEMSWNLLTTDKKLRGIAMPHLHFQSSTWQEIHRWLYKLNQWVSLILWWGERWMPSSRPIGVHAGGNQRRRLRSHRRRRWKFWSNEGMKSKLRY